VHKRRILLIDDSEAIHRDFREILCPEQSRSLQEVEEMEETLFGAPSSSETSSSPVFEVDSAFQGEEGLAKVREAATAGRPYSLAFLDYRMPPGWNGLETLRHLRKVAPSLQVVLCSAYSDYSWEEFIREFGETQPLRELRKPFDARELHQLALTLSEPSTVSKN
jgi:CheY-like chemotaxis protein